MGQLSGYAQMRTGYLNVELGEGARRETEVCESLTGVIKTVRQSAGHLVKMYNRRIGVDYGRKGWERPLLKGKAR